MGGILATPESLLLKVFVLLEKSSFFNTQFLNQGKILSLDLYMLAFERSVNTKIFRHVF